jgi:hypothetical protein
MVEPLRRQGHGRAVGLLTGGRAMRCSFLSGPRADGDWLDGMTRLIGVVE